MAKKTPTESRRSRHIRCLLLLQRPFRGRLFFFLAPFPFLGNVSSHFLIFFAHLSNIPRKSLHDFQRRKKDWERETFEIKREGFALMVFRPSVSPKKERRRKSEMKKFWLDDRDKKRADDDLFPSRMDFKAGGKECGTGGKTEECNPQNEEKSRSKKCVRRKSPSFLSSTHRDWFSLFSHSVHLSFSTFFPLLPGQLGRRINWVKKLPSSCRRCSAVH